MSSLAQAVSENWLHEKDEKVGANQAAAYASDHLIILCRKASSPERIDLVRAYRDEERAKADLELAKTLTDDEYWLKQVPMLLSTAQNASTSTDE